MSASYDELVKSSSISTFVHGTIVINHNEIVSSTPASRAQVVERLERHVCVHVIIVHVTQVRAVLFE